MFTNVGRMADAARKKIGGPYAEAEIIIGGDFNVPPRDTTTARAASSMLREHSASDRSGLINTTNSNPYDYFLVSDPRVLPGCVEVYKYTRDGSDHAATALDYVLR
ncbi:MAG TPA: endonuclease/exonuclease/phosphatase family protein [Longimicrobiales bacterium]